MQKLKAALNPPQVRAASRAGFPATAAGVAGRAAGAARALNALPAA